MFSAFERLVAFRYLRARRKQGFISVIAVFSFIGIMLGVATLIVVMSVMNGFRKELLGRILGINAHVSIVQTGSAVNNYDDLLKRIRTMPEVVSAAPVVNGQVLATANGKHQGVQVRGMRLEDLQAKKLVSQNIILGSLEDFTKPNAVIIGSRMSESMRIVPGETIRLISPKTTQTFIGAMPRLKDYTVVGVFEVGMFEYDSSVVFMPLANAQKYFKMDSSVSAIELMVASPEKSSELAETISAKLGDQYYAIDWKEANSHFFNSLKVERNVMFLILTLIILVAAFNIISGMVMLVIDKGRAIAIMRTMGATRGSILRIFFLCGASIGILGTLAGYLLGVGFATNIETIRMWLEGLTDTELFAAEIYFLSKLPADVQAGEVTRVLIMALSISIIAPLYPAWRAARVEPAEAIRYQ